MSIHGLNSSIDISMARYWPVIDDALRDAMFNRGVNVKVMGSYWNHTYPNMIRFLKSLASVDGTSKGSMQVVSAEVHIITNFITVSICNLYFFNVTF